MLCSWATDARVIPGCELSVNKEIWFPVETLPELRLNWSVQLRDGTVYGPLNLLAIRVLASERSISTGARLSEKGTGRKAILDDSLIPLLVEEMHQMLAGCGVLMNSLISSLHEAHRVTLNEVKEREVKWVDAQSRHEKSQDDFANLFRRLKEAQSALPPKETMIQQLEKALAHDQAQSEIRATETASKIALLNEELQATRTALLEESRVALQAKERLIRQLESDLAKLKDQAEIQATALHGQEALLEKKMGEAFERNDLLASQLAQAQESYQSLLKESARKEMDASTKLKRIEQDIKDSTELVTNTLRDVELRERRLLEMEKRSNERRRPFSQPGTVVDAEVINAEVIHAEVIHADPSGYMASDRLAAIPGVEKPSTGRHGSKTEKAGVLNNVEARLQKELKHWEVLKQEQKDHKKISPKWF